MEKAAAADNDGIGTSRVNNSPHSSDQLWVVGDLNLGIGGRPLSRL